MSIIRTNWDNDKLEIVNATEFSKPMIIQKKLTDDEIRIIQTEFSDKIEIVHTRDGRHAIKTFQHVGYIILPKHIIRITPKISRISFLNMVRYGLGLLKLRVEDFPASEEKEPTNYYDILVRFLLEELEILLQRGLYTSYVNYHENLTRIRGKILFKEHIKYNQNREDKIFCSFSELTSDVLENHIIKYTLFYLSQCHFIDDDIVAKLIEYNKRMDQVMLMSIHPGIFESINYSPLNEHYRPILKICELILRDVSLDLEVIGDKTISSFTIDMNKLFEDFVANLLIERLGEQNTKIQQTEFAEVKGSKLKVRLDIEIFQQGIPLIVLDTKYKEYDNSPDMGYIAQLALYSLSTGVKKCGLIYPGKFEPQFFLIKGDIQIRILPFNLVASNKQEFEENCSQFLETLKYSIP